MINLELLQPGVESVTLSSVTIRCRISPYKTPYMDLNCQRLRSKLPRRISLGMTSRVGCAVFKTFVSCEPHDGCCGQDLGKRTCQDHPPTKLNRHLVSQNVLLKVAPQIVASMGHFKLVRSYRPRRRLQYQKAVAKSPSKSYRSLSPYSLPKHVH